mmetsp:Transcript_65751/g.148359  ORF Transcript_65751/g.148359 Transcript_65751/m.148359 type:complete len:105 (+) Transcript_65751:44-358(+)
MAAVDIKITSGDKVIFEAGFTGKSPASSCEASDSLAEPGPGVYDYTGRHDGDKMAPVTNGGGYDDLARALKSCKAEVDKVLTEAIASEKNEGQRRKAANDKKPR